MPSESFDDLLRAEEAMVCVGFIGNAQGVLDGLPPGQYTVVATALHTGPYFQDYIAAGDEFLRLARAVYTTIDLSENEHVTVDLAFDPATIPEP